MTRPTAPVSTLVKPTFESRFHIDFEWWERSGQDLNLYLSEHICDVHRNEFARDFQEPATIDWIDPISAAVRKVNRYYYILLSHCSQEPDFLSEQITLVDAVFRALLVSGNRPMTPDELSRATGRSANTILRTLAGRTIYNGLRPAL